MIGVSENTFCLWEKGIEYPSQHQLITWRIKLGGFLDEIIASFIKTKNPELIHQFWEIIWNINKLTQFM
jgi:hypothetical protein